MAEDFVTKHLPRSLLRSARKARREMEGGARFQRIFRRISARVSLLRGPWAATLPIALAFAGVWFFPSGICLSSLANAPSAKSFLSTIWGVEAVAAALSGAAVIFGYQAFSISRHARSPGSVRAFAEDSWLFLILGVAVSGLLLPGLTLLGYGRGAPAGWAATWTAAVCGVGLALIPAVFVVALGGADEERLDKRRNRRLSHLVEVTIQQEILERLAINIAAEKCSEFGIAVVPVAVETHNPALRTVIAGRIGIVRDIRLRRLETLSNARKGLPLEPPNAFLLTRIGAHVNDGTPIAALPASIANKPSTQQSIVSIVRSK